MNGASVIFSCYAPGNANVPNNKNYNTLQRHIEINGYRCGYLVHVYKNGEMATALTCVADEEKEIMIFFRESHICGALVEAQYYAP